MASVVVTGGCGFIGQHLVAALSVRGDAVRVLDTTDPKRPTAGVDYIRASVADRAAVEAALDGVDCVYHLAGIAHLWRRDKDDFDHVNRRGTEVVLKAAAAKKIGRVVHCSTESILLPRRRNGVAVDESAAPTLDDMPGPYTRSKYRGEHAALVAAKGGMDVVVVNPTVPVGDGDHNATPPTAMLSLFLAGGSPFFLDCVLNLVDVRDLADGILRAGDNGRAGERYILGGDNVAMRELLPVLEEKSGRPMPRRSIPATVALATGIVAGLIADKVTRTRPIVTREGVEIALRSAPFDSSKAKRELGYAPRPIDQALTEVVMAFKRGGWSRV
jgi:nucleoside-diphosphate-sugar epimerase